MEPIAYLDVVAIDCNDPEPLVGFWSALLGTSEQSRSADWIALHPTVPGGPHLAFQVVPEPKVGKNRLHLDVNVRGIRDAIDRTVELGATVVGSIVEEADGRYQVMQDPAGNEFCLCELDRDLAVGRDV